jgi:hypothetical protein
VDQRSIRTIAKVGGLVGKTMDIDEKTRYNPEFVRIKIACRDVEAVPESAEGNLGIYIYDFFYEKEEDEENNRWREREGIKVDKSNHQPSFKKMKTHHEKGGAETKTLAVKEGEGKCTTDHGKGHKVQAAWSTPSNINSNKDELIRELDDDERIPAVNYEPSDSSDDFQLQVNKTLGDTVESSKARELWLTRCEFSEIVDKDAILNSEQKKV